MVHCTHLIQQLLDLSLFFQVKNLILAASAVVDSAPTTTSWATRRSAQTVTAVTWCPCHQILPLVLLSTLQTALKQLALQLPQHQLVQQSVLLIFIEFILFLIFNSHLHFEWLWIGDMFFLYHHTIPCLATIDLLCTKYCVAPIYIYILNPCPTFDQCILDQLDLPMNQKLLN